MKQTILLLILMLFSGFVFAQTPAPPQAQTAPTPPAAPAPISEDKPLANVLGWLTGSWEGEGVMSGDQEFVGNMKGNKELDDQAIVLLRESMNRAGGIAGGRKELMVVGFEGSTKKIVMTLHTSGNFIGIYSGELRGQNELVFTLATAQQGYVNRRILKLLPDGGLSFIIEGATPGKAVGKLVEINFKKKG